MSVHIIDDGKFHYVFGWDHPLQSFFLQKQDHSRPTDNQIVDWLTPPIITMYEVEDLVREARKIGLHIDSQLQTRLYGEKDDGV